MRCHTSSFLFVCVVVIMQHYSGSACMQIGVGGCMGAHATVHDISIIDLSVLAYNADLPKNYLLN